MDIFSTQILAAFKYIRTHKGRPDDYKIFKEILKESISYKLHVGGYSTSITTYG